MAHENNNDELREMLDSAQRTGAKWVVVWVIAWECTCKVAGGRNFAQFAKKVVDLCNIWANPASILLERLR
jgi:hypothetical protein